MNKLVKKLMIGLSAVALTIGAAQADEGAGSGDENGQVNQRFFVFGDSLSDGGNTLFRAGGSPFYYEYQFSNGPVWANLVGFDTISSATGVFAGAQGINFAAGGARTNVDIPLPSGGIIPSAATQINLFESLNIHPGRNDIFSVWIGGNDYLNGATDPFAVVAGISTLMDTLEDGGAENLIIFGLPSLGETPGILLRGDPVVRAQANFISSLHNSALRAEVGQRQEEPGGADIVFIDIERTFAAVKTHPSLFGFSVFEPGDVRLDGSGPSLTASCLGDFLVLDACNGKGYFFYDNVHPTREGHFLIARIVDAAWVSRHSRAFELAASQNSLAPLSIIQREALGVRLSASAEGRNGYGFIGSNHYITDAVIGDSQRWAVYGFATDGPLTSSGLTNFFAADERRRPDAEAPDAVMALIGADYSLAPGWTIGALTGHGQSFGAGEQGAESQVDSTSAVAYVAYANDDFQASFELGRSSEHLALTRASLLSELPVIHADADSSAFHAAFSAAQRFAVGAHTALGPEMRVEFTQRRIGAYAETGTLGILDREYGAQTFNEGRAYLGLRLVNEGELGSAGWSVEMSGGALSSFGDSSNIAALARTPALGRVDLEGEGWRLGLDAELALTSGLQLGLTGETISADNDSAAAGKLTATWRF